MSFIDGIFNGITGAVRGVLGIDDDRPAKHAGSSERSANLARDTGTAYEREPREAGTPPSSFSLTDHIAASGAAAATSAAGSGAGRASAPGMTSAWSLVDQLRLSASQRFATPDAGQPMAGASGQDPVEAPRARVLDAATRSEYGTVDTLTGGSDAATAARNVQRGLDYYASTFGRNGIDDAGGGVDVLIDDHSTDEHGEERFRGNGGYYAMDDGRGVLREAIHFGSGTSYEGAKGLVDQASMLNADDLAIHELTHGVIRKESGHLGGGADESGATNEAFADVMAAAATRDWTIGEGMYTDRSAYRMMRNIADPDDPRAIHGLWTSMRDVEAAKAAGEEVEEHWASGVVSTAAYRVQQRFGGEQGWQVVEQVFYDAIAGDRLGDMSFGAVASALRTSAGAVYGQGSTQQQVFDEELRRAGL